MMGFFSGKRKNFTPLPQTPNSTSSNSGLESEESLLENSTWVIRPKSTLTLWISIPLIVSSIIVAHVVGIWIGSQYNSTTTTLTSTSAVVEQSSPYSAINQISNYSPLLEDINITYTMQRFNGSLLKETIYRQGPSEEVDAAWDKLGVNYHALSVPDHLAQKSGLAPDQVKINQKYGGGYPANVEGMHHLHCLNLLRQGLYWNVEYYRAKGEGAFTNAEHIVKKHICKFPPPPPPPPPPPLPPSRLGSEPPHCLLLDPDTTTAPV
ncbi:hypothetical protein B7494_g5107 [Chlorociboria aeruginascens]|nr:hypothetical protein B7494_g5107 [Chlorociboria aeruginascens]